MSKVKDGVRVAFGPSQPKTLFLLIVWDDDIGWRYATIQTTEKKARRYMTKYFLCTHYEIHRITCGADR